MKTRYLVFLMACFLVMVAMSMLLPKATAAISPLASPHHTLPMNHLYPFDETPLGRRAPLIILPGRAQESQGNPWWKKFYHAWQAEPALQKKYKLYVFLYDSTVNVEVPTLAFRHALHDFLDTTTHSQAKIVLLSYSLGGLIARDALIEEPALLEHIDTVFGMSVPYHGSPLFDKNWLGQHFTHYSPLRRGWDELIYTLYLKSKSNLVDGMAFVNFDGSKPQSSQPKAVLGLLPREALPLSPNLPRWKESETPALRVFKSKLLVYASYLKSQYSEHGKEGLVKDDLTVFGTVSRVNNLVLGSVVPTYVPSVHRTLDFMGRQMAQLPVANVPYWKKPKSYPLGHGHPYRFNDGVIPASSLFYLPVRDTPYTEYIGAYPQLWDICGGRFFDDLDHVDLGHYRYPEFPLVKKDVFHGNEKAKKPMQWLLDDLKNLHTASGFQCH